MWRNAFQVEAPLLTAADLPGVLDRLAPLQELAASTDLGTVQRWVPRVRRFSCRLKVARG